MFQYLSSLVIILFEMICCKIFFESFCECERFQKKWQKVLLIMVLLCVDYICVVAFAKCFLVKQAVVVLLISTVMYFYFRTGFRKSVGLTVLYQGMLIAADYVAYVANTALFMNEELIGQQYTVEGTLVIALGKIVLFLGVLFVKKQFGKKSTELLEDTEWIRFLFFPVFTIITIAAMIMNFQDINNQTQADVLYVIALGMVIMNVFVYYLINDIVERETRLHEKKVFEIQVKNQMDMYHSISENYEYQKCKTHEFRNQILCMEGLVQNGDYEELKQYIGRISGNFHKEQNIINTNHVIINAILNTKYQEALGKQIVFVFRVNDLSKIELEDEDIVILLANLIDNAIEACEQCEQNRVIKLKFMREDGFLILSVKNTFQHAVIYEDGQIKTSKNTRPEEHGIGIKNIIRVVERYDGSYVITDENGEFSFSIMIPL